jgi:PKD repeat protein
MSRSSRALPLAAALVLLAGSAFPVGAQTGSVTIQVDVAANRRAINPLIYGTNFATQTQLADLNCPLNRSGGNARTRYNWQANASNRAMDWYFESISEAGTAPSAEQDQFIADTHAGGARPMVTIPTIGWVAKLGPNRSKLASFSIAKYGAQTGNDWQWFPDAGNGIWTNGNYVTGNDPTDACQLSDSLFQQGWIQHLTQTFGTATTGGVPYYVMDNEPSIWHSTHRDVHPTGATMEEIRDRVIDYATRVKDVDPSAQVVAPEEWGWSGFIFSGYDQQYGAQHGWSYLPDRANHGGWDYLPWLLDQWRQRDQALGRRLVDVFSVHYYPQGGEFSNDTSTTMQQRRNRSTRSLWDPNYLDETWINDRVRLVPRLRQWVSSYYPGTKTAITEYNWGAEGHINGATAQADILGIFGREGLDIATRWTTPDASTPTYKAMKMYRNYDGNRSTFGDTSVACTVPNPDSVSAFAAERSSDGALTVMVINKATASTSVTINLANFTSTGVSKAWRLTSTNAITRLTDLSHAAGTLATTVPAQSITLYVLTPSGAPNQAPTAVFSATPVSGTAPLAVSYTGQASSDSDGTIVSYAWVFGDGGTATGPTASRTYTTPGSYTARLTVTDNGGSTASATTTITVSPGTTAVSAPSGLTGSGARGSATLRWTDNSSNESGFYIERQPKGSSTWARVGQVGANVTTFVNTTSAGNYNFRVQAFNSTTGVVSNYSNVVQVRVK